MIKIINGCIKYGDKLIFDEVNVDFKPGKIYGLIGDNGSGKTLLMKAILGFIELTSGEIYFDSKQVGIDMEFPDSVGFIIENPGFIQEYNQFQNLELLASIKGIANKQTITKMIEQVGLDPNNKNKVKTFSLGMRQRLAIAQALMENPQTIILDEPMNSLDKNGVQQIRKLLIERRDKGATIIISSHINGDIESLCDEVYKIEAGRINKN